MPLHAIEVRGFREIAGKAEVCACAFVSAAAGGRGEEGRHGYGVLALMQ